MTSITPAGAKNVLPLTSLGTPRSLTLDGAGVLYILNGSAEKSLITYDTVRGVQGTFALPLPANSFDSIALNTTGDLTAYASAVQAFYTMNSFGVATKTPLAASSVTSNGSMILKADGSLYVGGSSIQQIDRSGIVTQLKNSEATSSVAAAGYAPLAVDAAGSVYSQHGSAILVQGDASSATLPDALTWPPTAASTDRTAHAGPHTGNAQLRRRYARLHLGRQSGHALQRRQSAPDHREHCADGTGYAFASDPASTCVSSAVLAPSASCTLAIAMHAEKTELQSGTVTVTTNSLNGANTLSTLSMTAHPDAAGSQAVFSPTTLAFPSTTVLVASAPLTVTLFESRHCRAEYQQHRPYRRGQRLLQPYPELLHRRRSEPCGWWPVHHFGRLQAADRSWQAASISVIDDLGGVANSSQTVAITGTGTAAPAPVITATYSTTYTSSTSPLAIHRRLPLPFSATWSSSAQSATRAPSTLTNTGNATLNISSIGLAITGTTTLPFTQTNTCGATLAASAKCVVTVIFSPVATTTTTANIYAAVNTTAAVVVASNALGSPQSFAIAAYPTPRRLHHEQYDRDPHYPLDRRHRTGPAHRDGPIQRPSQRPSTSVSTTCRPARCTASRRRRSRPSPRLRTQLSASRYRPTTR